MTLKNKQLAAMLVADHRELLRQAIKDSGLSVAKIAHRAYISNQTIYNYINGKSEMNLDTYHKILAALDQL